MKYNGFEVEVIKEGKVEVGKLERDHLPIKVGKTTVDVDIAGMQSQFFEQVEALESGARSGVFLAGYPNEVSNVVLSDDRKSSAIIKLKADRYFWENRRKALSSGETEFIFRGCVKIESKVKNGHFHRTYNGVRDALTAESTSFERIDFSNVIQTFENFCAQINGYFNEKGEIPKPVTVTEMITDSRDVEVSLTVTFTCIIPKDDREQILRCYDAWSNRLYEHEPLEPAEPTPLPQKRNGQQAIITTAGSHEC